MKKLNASEVSTIVGGTVTNCSVAYEKNVTGTGATAVTTCNRITTCENKYGKSVNSVPAHLSSCA